MPSQRRQSRQDNEELSATLSELGESSGRAEMASVDLLVQALRQSGISTPRESYRAPTFMGEGDVELFLRQFVDVAAVNGWSDAQHTLHL